MDTTWCVPHSFRLPTIFYMNFRSFHNGLKAFESHYDSISGTVVADASHYKIIEAPIVTDPHAQEVGKLIDCTYDGQGRGKCVHQNVNVGEGTTEAPQGATIHYAGITVPHSTFTVDKTSLTTLSADPLNSGGIGGNALFMGGGAVAIGIVLGFVLVI